MPKKQSKEVSNIKLRRSKPAPVKSPEYLTDEEEICLEADHADAPQQYEHSTRGASSEDVEFEEPQHSTSNSNTEAVSASKPKTKKPKPKKPSALVNFQSEREAFQQYVNEQRVLLAKERMEHLEQIKQESVKEKAKNAANDARMRLMSIL